jgi:hypothetical protein
MLLKGSRFKRMQEPFNEQIASMIMDYYNIYHVGYGMKRTKDNIPYSECKCMVNRDIEFINAQFIMNIEDYVNKEPYNHYIDICKRNGIMDVKEKVDEMIAVDFLIGNEDRHKGNFGIVRDADSLKWLETAPIFDNGNCLFFDCDNDELKERGIDSLGKSFGDSNRLNLNLIKYPKWYNRSGNEIVDMVHNCLSYNEKLTNERINDIVKITKERVNVFEKTIESKE